MVVLEVVERVMEYCWILRSTLISMVAMSMVFCSEGHILSWKICNLKLKGFSPFLVRIIRQE